MIPAKKSLGQNFLKSKKTLDLIVETAEINSHDIVLEAGPGKGALTEVLLVPAREVVAVEKDERLIMHLNFKFKKEIELNKLKILSQDVLEFKPESENLQSGGYKIVANIPYYITGNFLRHFLSEVNQPSKMVLMVQKEVARRIVARDGKESLLSLSVKVYGSPKYIETVKAALFQPQPKVDSAIILIDKISKENFKHISENLFFEVLRLGFSSKRKMLLGNLSKTYPRESLEKIFQELAISPEIRAEDLALGKWKALVKEIAKVPKTETPVNDPGSESQAGPAV